MPNEHCGSNKVQRSAVVWHELLKLRKGVWVAHCGAHTPFVIRFERGLYYEKAVLLVVYAL